MAKKLSSPRIGILCGTVLLCAALPSPPQNTIQHHDIVLHGHIQTTDGRAIPAGVMVTLETRDGIPLASHPTDSGGNFEFAGLESVVYTLSVKADGFQNYEQTLDFTDPGDTFRNVIVALSPIAKPKDLPALTDQAAPKSARKEFQKGSRAWRENKPAEARNHLEKAVEEYPCYARAQAALAEVDVAERKLESAEAGYKQAIHCDGSYSDAFYQLARLYMTENKPADSEAILRQALRLSPSAWLLHYQLGTAQFAMGEYRAAAQDFLTAQSLHPDMPAEFHAKLANTYLKMAEYAKALAEVETYLRLSPEGPYAASAKKVSQILRSRGVTGTGPRTGTPSTAGP
jgi:tetratricopeptide (TPR) repeat protein